MSEQPMIQSVAKAMHLLELLSQARSPLTLTELHLRTGWPRSTIFGLLSTMREYRVVSQWPDGRYALGLRLFEFGCSVSSVWDISAVAEPYLQRLAVRNEGTAVLSVYDGGQVMALAQAESRAGMRVVVEIGMELPLHATSQGKLFLSAMRPAAVQKRLAEKPMALYTPHTIQDMEQLEQELSAICAQGYAVEDGEYKIGLRSVSAPIYASDGQMRYALSLVGMFRRVSSREFLQATQDAVAAAAQISSALGFSGTQKPLDKNV